MLPSSLNSTLLSRALFYRALFGLLFVLTATVTLRAQPVSADIVVPITVTTSASTPSITLTWTNPTGLTGIFVVRKSIFQTSWTLLSQPATTVTSYTDNTVVKGVPYEYMVMQQAQGATPSQRIGLVYAGIEVAPVTTDRGIVLFVVDESLLSPLATEVARFENDLRGDGWRPVRIPISPVTATVQSVKTLIRDAYNADPDHTVAAFLLGNVPVPYSGNIAPDGHTPDHLGAWPADFYYGDMDEAEWTDNSINNPGAARAANRNIPGDGKFDQSQTPTLPEIVVSRVDFSNLVNWGVGQNELYRRYLNKDHNFRTGQFRPQNKTLIDDNFGYFSGEAFAQNGWRNGYALTGVTNTEAGDFFTATDNSSYLIGYGTGAGSYNSAAGVGTSDNFISDSVNVVFSMLFGSYFGDWDYETNPLMPSALASKGGILTCSWAGRPNWHLHHMGMGEPIMTSTYWVWLNSFLASPVYPPNYGADLVHVSLLGDPTLRAHAVYPPTNLTATAGCGTPGVTLQWTASSEANAGYLVYRSATPDGVFTLLTPSAVGATNYTDATALTGLNYYQVKALRLETVPTGSYYNQSLAATTNFQYVGSGPALTATTSATGASCFGGANGTATVLPGGGSGAYAYLWSNAQTTQQATVLTAGLYTVTVTDAAGCTTTATATITQPATALTALTTPYNADCHGAATGGATVEAQGGAGSYTYLWSTMAATDSIGGLTTATYVVTVTDALGCTVQAAAFVGEPLTPLTADVTHVNVDCAGAANGSISLQIEGGTPTYSINWLDLPGNINPEDRTDLSGGVYTAIVTDLNGCEITVPQIVVQEPFAIDIEAITTNSACAGNATGAISLQITGGVEPFSFNWSNAATTQNLTNIPSAEYTVTVTDASGCTNTLTAYVDQNTTLALSMQSSPVTCFGSPNGTATVAITGGNPPYDILWDNSANTPQISGLFAGMYRVTVTDMAGCSQISSVEIDSPEPILAELEFVFINPCESQLGVITTTVQGGVSPYSYVWSNGATTANLGNAEAIVYLVTITDSQGCSRVFSNAEPPIPTAPVASAHATDATCFGQQNGSIDLTVGGGAPPYVFNWADVPGVENTEDRENLFAGTYVVVVTDDAGCSVTTQVMVGQPNPLSIFTQSTPSGCATASGSLSASASGGTMPYQYVWSNGLSGTPLNAIAAGVYTVTVTDGAGCTQTATRTVTQTAGPQATITAVNAGCNGQVGGSATVIPVSGTDPISFLWSNGSTESSIDDLSAGPYSVTVTDGAGCTVVLSTQIGETMGLSVSEQIQNVSCFGGSDGAISLMIAGGQSPYQALWSNGESGFVLSGLEANLYVVTVTDVGGCASTATYSVTEPDALDVDLLATNVNCNGGNNGAITVSLSGGTAPYVTDWSDLPGSADPANRAALAAGQYMLLVTDAHGCTSQNVVLIVQPAAPEYELAGPDTVCLHETGVFTLIGFSNYQWSTGNGGVIEQGQGESTISVVWNNLDNNFIQVAFTDVANCAYTAVLDVYVDDCVGVNEAAAWSDVTISPNPFGDLITIQTDRVDTDELSIRLYDAGGRLCLQKVLPSTGGMIDATVLPAGIYTLHILRAEEAGVWKLVKSR